VVRRRPKIAYKALVQAVGSEVSVRTVWRILRQHHMQKWRSMKRIKLTKEGVKEIYIYIYNVVLQRVEYYSESNTFFIPSLFYTYNSTTT
jgi:hypothetical protein